MALEKKVDDIGGPRVGYVSVYISQSFSGSR